VWFQNRRAKWRKCESRSQLASLDDNQDGNGSRLVQSVKESFDSDDVKSTSPPQVVRSHPDDVHVDVPQSRTTLIVRHVAREEEQNSSSEEELSSTERCSTKSSLAVTEEEDTSNKSSSNSLCVKQEPSERNGDEVKSLTAEDLMLGEPKMRQRSVPRGSVRPHLEGFCHPISSPSSYSLSPNDKTISHDVHMSPMQADGSSLTGGVSRERTRRRVTTHRSLESHDEIALTQSQILSQPSPLDLSSMTGCGALRCSRDDFLSATTDETADDPVDLRLSSLAFHPPAVFGV
jgi:hypothetical protein